MNGEIIGLYGHCGDLLDSVGFYSTGPINQARKDTASGIKVSTNTAMVKVAWKGSADTTYRVAFLVEMVKTLDYLATRSKEEYEEEVSSLLAEFSPGDVFSVTASIQILPDNTDTDVFRSWTIEAIAASAVRYRKAPSIGGRGGSAFDDIREIDGPPIVGLKALRICHGDRIDSLQAEYMKKDGTQVSGARHGRKGGEEEYIEFGEGESITSVAICSSEFGW